MAKGINLEQGKWRAAIVILNNDEAPAFARLRRDKRMKNDESSPNARDDKDRS
jgi:hypothetical protein